MYRLAILSLVLTVLVGVAMAGQAAVSPCKTEKKAPTFTPKVVDLTMDVSGCDNPNNCTLIRNTTHRVIFEFVPLENTAGIKMQVYGLVMRVRVPYNRNVDLCNKTVAEDGTKCDKADGTKGLEAGKKYTIPYEFYIRSRFPELPVPVEFELWDGDSKLSCSQVQVIIQCNRNEANCKKSPPGDSDVVVVQSD